MGQILKKYSAPIVWMFPPEQILNPAKVAEYLKENCSGSSKGRQLTALCWAPANAYWVLLITVQHQLQPEEKENKSADTMVTQAAVKPQGQPKPVQRRKYTTICLVDDDREAGPSQPAEESEPEIITESWSIESLCSLRKDLAQWPNESILSWLIRVWDTAGDGTILDSTEVRHLESLSRDVGIDQGIARPEPLSLWMWLLTSVKERYLCPEDLQLQQSPWKTMEQGIQCLQELAMITILFSNNDQPTKSPDLRKCTTLMWLKLAWLGTQVYSQFLGMLQWNEVNERVGTMTRRFQTYEDTVHTPTQAQVSTV